MTTILDPARRVHTTVLPCRSCKKPIYFSLNEKGKRTPYEVDAEGQPTRINHFLACPDRRRWKKTQAGLPSSGSEGPEGKAANQAT